MFQKVSSNVDQTPRKFSAGFATSAQTKKKRADLCFPEEELQVSAAQDAVVLDVARKVHGAGPVHCAVDLHVAVDGVQVFLSVLEQTERVSVVFSSETPH